MAPYGPTLLRIAAGLVFVADGVRTLFGVGGGGGLTASAELFQQIGLWPAFVLAMLAGLVEIFGGLLLAAGLFTRIAAAVFAIGMLVALWKVHWNGAPNVGHGYELDLVLAALLASLLLTGPGALAIDRPRADAATAAPEPAPLETGTV